jgi:histone-lysine N-methyltransferase SETMAR
MGGRSEASAAPIRLGSPLAALLLEFPSASAGQMAKHFRASHYAIKEMLGRQVDLRTFSRRWVRYRRSDDQKAVRVRDSKALLAILRRLQDNSFEGISTEDESWFLYEHQSDSMFAASRETVRPRNRHEDQCNKTMITVFFTPTRLLVPNALTHSQTFTQEYFITELLPILHRENIRFRLKYSDGPFFLHLDNSRCQNGKKITVAIRHRRFARAPHPPYSPDLSPCNFWLFGMMKHCLKDREIHGVQALISALTDILSDLTFEDVQAFFLDWMERSSWVIDNNGEYYIK